MNPAYDKAKISKHYEVMVLREHTIKRVALNSFLPKKVSPMPTTIAHIETMSRSVLVRWKPPGRSSPELVEFVICSCVLAEVNKEDECYLSVWRKVIGNFEIVSFRLIFERFSNLKI